MLNGEYAMMASEEERLRGAILSVIEIMSTSTGIDLPSHSSGIVLIFQDGRALTPVAMVNRFSQAARKEENGYIRSDQTAVSTG